MAEEKKRQDLIKQRAEAEKEAAEAAKKAAKEKAEAEKKLAETIRDLEQEKKDVRVGQLDDFIDQEKAKLEENRQIAKMGIQEFIENQKQEKFGAIGERETARIEELKARQARGVKLGRKQQEQVDAFDAIKLAQKEAERQAKEIAQAQARRDLLAQEQVRALVEIDKELKGIRKDNKDLLALG